MPDLHDGESTEMQGSGKSPYILKNTGGVYSCSCPAWAQSIGGHRKTNVQSTCANCGATAAENIGQRVPGKKARTKTGFRKG